MPMAAGSNPASSSEGVRSDTPTGFVPPSPAPPVARGVVITPAAAPPSAGPVTAESATGVLPSGGLSAMGSAAPTPDSATMVSGAATTPSEGNPSAPVIRVSAGPSAKLAALVPERFTGRAAARYEVVKELGRGGMGVVLSCFDRDLGRLVAMKVIRAEIGEAGDFAARFLEEARATAQLEHPGIVPVHDVGIDDAGRLYFTMKLVEGETLASLVKRCRSDAAVAAAYPFERRLELFEDMCRAVYFAHERGIIHRDLKPQNVMVGPYGEVQVMDWGLAKAVPRGKAGDAAVPSAEASSASDALATQEVVRRIAGGERQAETILGAVVGTIAYMAPEQARGASALVGRPADVFSLGATLYHILTGRPPYEGEKPAEVVARVKNASFASPRTLAPEVPPAVEAICLRAMAARPEDRYASAKALADDLQAFLEHRPVTAYPEGGLDRAARLFRRHRAAASVAGVALLLALIVGGTLAVRTFRAQARRQQAMEEMLVAQSLGSYAAEIGVLEHAIELDPDWTVVRVELANVCAQAANEQYRLGQWRNYIDLMRKAADTLVPFTEGPGAENAEPGTVLNRIQSLEAAGASAEEVRPLYERAARSTTRGHASLLARGCLAMERGAWAEVVTHTTSALEVDPLAGTARYRRGFARLMLGDPRGAVIDARGALALYPDNDWASSVYARAYIAQGAHRQAAMAIVDGLRINPYSPMLYDVLLDLARLEGEAERAKALESYSNAKANGPRPWFLDRTRFPLPALAKRTGPSAAPRGRAKEALARGAFPEAVEQATAAIGISPADGEAHRIRAAALRALGQDGEAEGDERAAALLYPLVDGGTWR